MQWGSCQPDLLPPLLLFYTRYYELLWTAVRWKVLTNELFPRNEQSVHFLSHSSLLVPGNQAVFVSSPHSILWRTLLNSWLFQVLESNCFGFCILMRVFEFRHSSHFSCCPPFKINSMIVTVAIHFLFAFPVWPSGFFSGLLGKTLVFCLSPLLCYSSIWKLQSRWEHCVQCSVQTQGSVT